MPSYRNDLPPIPWRMIGLPVHRGYPVPWFVAEVSPGVYDFRVADAAKMGPAVKQRLCWICGRPLLQKLVFTVGPMCALNRISSEPPAHQECATFAALACPFLNQREVRRNASNLPDGISDPAGIPIMRQPGVTMLWTARSYRPLRVDGGVLFKMGDPLAVAWYRAGRAATRAEVLESIASGYPFLREAAEMDGPEAIKELEAAHQKALNLIPAE